jgi:hypothetical protein
VYSYVLRRHCDNENVFSNVENTFSAFENTFESTR